MSLNKIVYIESDSYNPYVNLSLEEDLLNKACENILYFYLWQNENTVVIGKNQSAKQQCNIDLMKKDNVYLARRSSGGGAVFHDLGNLNYTFIYSKGFFDIEKNLNVIKKALSYHGIEAYFSGRNDLLVNGNKISGQAYLNKEKFSLHHGTLLVNANLKNLSKYLKKDDSKLKTHGVKSHSQRVSNLSSFNNSISVEKIKESLKIAISEEFKLPLYKKKEMDNFLFEKYKSNTWLYRLDTKGQRINKRFDYGLIDMYLKISNNVITQIDINSDIMDLNIIDEIKRCLINKKLNSKLLCQIKLSNKVKEKDVINLLEENLCMI